MTAAAMSQVAGGVANALASSPSSSGYSASSFDSSGWNVNFGSGSISSSRSQEGELSGYLQYAVIAVVAVLAVRMFRK